MKKYLLLLLVLLFPVVGSSKTVNYFQILFRDSDLVLEPGDVFDFSNCEKYKGTSI